MGGEAHDGAVGAAVIVAALREGDHFARRLQRVLAQEVLLEGESGADAEEDQPQKDDEHGAMPEGGPNAGEEANNLIIV